MLNPTWIPVPAPIVILLGKQDRGPPGGDLRAYRSTLRVSQHCAYCEKGQWLWVSKLPWCSLSKLENWSAVMRLFNIH